MGSIFSCSWAILDDLHSSLHVDLRQKFELLRLAAVFQEGFLDFSLSGGVRAVANELIGSEEFELYFFHSASKDFLRRRGGGATRPSTGNYCVRVDWMVHVMIRMLLFSCKSIIFVCLLLIHSGAETLLPNTLTQLKMFLMWRGHRPNQCHLIFG